MSQGSCSGATSAGCGPSIGPWMSCGKSHRVNRIPRAVSLCSWMRWASCWRAPPGMGLTCISSNSLLKWPHAARGVSSSSASLHQAFEEYSYRLAREMREEWSKIQGRFIDLAVNVGADEQLAILGQAIDGGRGEVDPSPLSIGVAEFEQPGYVGRPVPVAGGLLAPASGGCLPAGTHLQTKVRPEPAQRLRIPQLRRAERLPGFSCAVLRTASCIP